MNLNLVVLLITGLIAVAAALFFLYQTARENGINEGIEVMQTHLRAAHEKLLSKNSELLAQIETSVRILSEKEHYMDKAKQTNEALIEVMIQRDGLQKDIYALEEINEGLLKQPCSHTNHSAANELIEEMQKEGFFTNIKLPKSVTKKSKKVTKNAKTTKRKK